MASSKTRWTYSFSNLGPKKQIAGTTFYKVSVGSDVKWLSMEGIRMLEKARQANVKFKTVRKAVTHYTMSGTKRRLKIMRGNIERSIEELMDIGGYNIDEFGYNKYTKGMKTMLEKAGLEDLKKEFGELLSVMNEEQIREFYNRNGMLLKKFFADSGTLGSANATDPELHQAVNNAVRNATKLRDNMLRIITRDMRESEINLLFAQGKISALTAKHLMTDKRSHL